MTTDREAAEWVARTYPADAHPTVAALAAAYLRAVALHADDGTGFCDHCTEVSGDIAIPWHCKTAVALDLTRRGCPGCGALIPNDMARCALCGWPTEETR